MFLGYLGGAGILSPPHSTYIQSLALALLGLTFNKRLYLYLDSQFTQRIEIAQWFMLRIGNKKHNNFCLYFEIHCNAMVHIQATDKQSNVIWTNQIVIQGEF